MVEGCIATLNEGAVAGVATMIASELSSCAAKSSIGAARFAAISVEAPPVRRSPIGSPCPLRCARYRHRWRSRSIWRWFRRRSRVSPAVNRSHRPPGTAEHLLLLRSAIKAGVYERSTRGVPQIVEIDEGSRTCPILTRVRGENIDSKVHPLSAFRAPSALAFAANRTVLRPGTCV